jgi:hypothetical protein
LDGATYESRFLMPNAESLAAVSQGRLVQNVDDQRAEGDNFKLPVFLRPDVNAGLIALETADNDTVLTESDRTGGSAAARGAIDAIKELLRNAHSGIKAIPGTQINAGQRLEVFTAYGWSGGKLGKLGDARVIGLARLGVQKHSEVPAGSKYNAEIVAGLTAQLAIFDKNVDSSKVGNREAATRKRDQALEAFKVLLARVRFYYCCVSAEADQTAELAKIGFQPRRDPGTVAKPTTAAAAPAKPGS